MSFLKITDPKKREAMIREFIETRKRIKDNLIAEKVGKMETQIGLEKLFKPITETQKTTAEEITETQKTATKEITEGIKPIKEGIEKLPAITFPAYPSVNLAEEEIQNIGEVASDALRKFLRKDEADKTYGLRDENNKFYIGNKLAVIDGDDLIVGKYEYKGTPGLWELITSKKPDETKYNDEDLENYAKLMVRSNAIRRNYDPTSTRPLSSPGYKWKKLISVIWRSKNMFLTEGDGLVVLPSDPNALLERLDLLLASKEAGHTGVRNELVSICDELKRQGVINANEYKNLNSIIKK